MPFLADFVFSFGPHPFPFPRSVFPWVCLRLGAFFPFNTAPSVIPFSKILVWLTRSMDFRPPFFPFPCWVNKIFFSYPANRFFPYELFVFSCNLCISLRVKFLFYGLPRGPSGVFLHLTDTGCAVSHPSPSKPYFGPFQPPPARGVGLGVAFSVE